MADPIGNYLAGLGFMGGPEVNPGALTPEQMAQLGLSKFLPVTPIAPADTPEGAIPVGGAGVALAKGPALAKGLQNMADLGQYGLDPDAVPLTQDQLAGKSFQAVKDILGVNIGIPKPPGSAGVFGGMLSQDPEAVARLRAGDDMMREGATPSQIWNETRTWAGPEGRGRYEIPDTASNITGSAERALMNAGPGGKVIAPLGEILSHPAAYEAYPGLPDMKAMVGLNPFSIHGWFAHGAVGRGEPKLASVSNEIGGPQGIHGILLHEINHGIQGKEGFPSGSNLDVAGQRGQEFLNKLNKQISDLGSDHWMLTREENPLDAPDMARIAAQIERLRSMRDQFQMHFDPFQYYKRSAGEVESRGVQARMMLPQHLLNAIPPEYTMGLDVPVPQRWIDYANR